MPGTYKPIKVVQIIARMNVGGPAVLIDIVHRGLDPADFESQLWTGDVERGEADHLVAKGSPSGVHKIDGLGRSVRIGGDARAFVSLVRLMRAERPDIVHTHTAKAGVLGRLAAFVARVPIRVHTFHGHVLQGYFSTRVTTLIVLIERLLAYRTSALAAVGAQVRDDLLAAGIGESRKYLVVPPGVAITSNIDRSEARRQLGLPLEAPIALFVGRLTKIKRADRLVEAFRLVKQAVPDAVLAIAGEGDLLEETKRLAADLGDSVRFLGWQADLAAVYPAADVVVLTSDNEGMPVTLIEASMLGIPCVTTNVGSAGEVVVHERTGFVTSTSPLEIAASLIRILSDRELAQQLGIQAHQHAETNFSASRLVDDHATLYRQLMAASQGK